MTKKILSLLLVLCFIVGLLPTMASAAENTTLELKPAITNDPDKWAEFVESFSSAKLGDMVSIEVTGSVELPAPLVNANGATFYIRGIGSGASIAPLADTKEKFVNTHLLTFTGGTDTS